MAIVLGDNRYGKAETRLVQVSRGQDSHDVRDLNVSVTLAGDLVGTHLTGDNSGVLPTDTQKNTVYAFAAEHGVGQIENFGARLARHFVDSQPAIHRSRVTIEEYRWERLGPYSFQRSAGETRTATVSYDGTQTWVVAGLTGLLLFNSTGSEFRGYVKDRYTTLPETTDRILATAVNADWRYGSPDADWTESYVDARQALLAAFAGTYSLSLQQTLYAMGQLVLERRTEIVEVRLSLPNKHHFPVDLEPFGMSNDNNDNDVFYASDRPYGLIEGTVLRDDAPPAGLAWW
jgi:urate oxidase